MVYTLIEMMSSNVQNSSGTTSRRRVVSLQSFEHFMASFLWSIRVLTMENCGRFVFCNNIYFSTKKKQNNRHCVRCYVNSMVYTLMDHSSRPIRKIRSVIVKSTIYAYNFVTSWPNFSLSSLPWYGGTLYKTISLRPQPTLNQWCCH